MKIHCCKPYLSAYEFMRHLCAALIVKGKNKVPIDYIVEKIYNYRINNGDSIELFRDIEFRKGLNGIVSNDIMESIGELQTFGIIGKENPKYVNMNILMPMDKAEKILSECAKDISNTMEKIAESF